MKTLTISRTTKLYLYDDRHVYMYGLWWTIADTTPRHYVLARAHF
jgi:hypothetical protein